MFLELVAEGDEGLDVAAGAATWITMLRPTFQDGREVYWGTGDDEGDGFG